MCASKGVKAEAGSSSDVSAMLRWRLSGFAVPMMTEATAGWSAEDVETVGRLYMRFTEGLEAQFDRFEQDENR